MVKVSIIVPVYNTYNYLDECIKSIMDQTLEDIEIILVNDGSTDSSKDICEKYRELDNRIVVINKDNEGVGKARNVGIDKSSGEYIMFCDSDDYVEKTWCEEMYNLALFNKYSLVGCGYYIHSYRDKKSYIKQVSDVKYLSIENKSDIMNLYMLDISNLPVNKIFESKIIKDNNLRFDEEITLGEDLIFNLEYLKYTNEKILIVNKPLYNYIYRNRETLTTKYYINLFDIYNKLYSKLYNSMIMFNANMVKYNSIFYSSYFESLNIVLKNTFNKKSKYTLLQKIKYTKYILRSKEFNSCLSSIDLSHRSFIYKSIIKGKLSFLFYIYIKLINIRDYFKSHKIRLKTT